MGRKESRRRMQEYEVKKESRKRRAEGARKLKRKAKIEDQKVIENARERRQRKKAWKKIGIESRKGRKYCKNFKKFGKEACGKKR